MLRVVELQAGFSPPKKMFIGSATGLSLVLVSIRLNTLLGLSMTTPCYNVYPSLELLSLLHIKRNITIFTPGQKPYIWKNKYFPSVIGSDGRAACDWLWANSSYASEGVCVGPDLLNTSYKLQHIYGISVGWNLVKNKRPVSDFFAFSLSLSLINEHTAQSAFVLCVFSCMSGWGRARRADLSPEPITDGPIAQQPCFVDGELESCQVNPKSEKKNWRNVDGI